MTFTDLNIRDARPRDRDWIDRARRQYWDADLELPKGLRAPGVLTGVAELHASGVAVPLASLTGTQAVVLDPLVRNADYATDGRKLVSAILMLERALTFSAQQAGAVDAYIAVPKQLTEYHEIVRKAGYEETVQHCKIFRRALTPDTETLLGDERAANEQKAKALE